jgi:hypothetical protein
MKTNNINKSEKFLSTIEAEHYSSKNKIAQGDLKTPTVLVKSDINIQLKSLNNMSKAEAMRIKFCDYAVGYGTSLFEVKKKLLEKGIPEKYVVEKQLFGIDIDQNKILATMLVIDPKRMYNIKENIIVGDSSKMSFTVKGLTHSWNNEPYLKGDSGRTPVYDRIIMNVDNKNPIQTSEAHLLPKSISLSDDHKSLRENFFNKGLEHWREWSLNSFEGAKVRTVSYICNRGYDGEINVWYDNIYKFSYDYRKVGYIINGGTSALTKLLIDVRNNNVRPIIVKGIKPGPKRIYLENLEDIKDESFKDSVPVLKINSNKGFNPKKDIGYVKAGKNDMTDFDKPKLVMGYRPSGEEFGNHRLGTMNVIPAGILVQPKDRFITFDSTTQAENRKTYLKSQVVENFFLKRSRTSPTIDASGTKGFNQLSFIENIDPDIVFKTNNHIIDYFSKKYNLSAKTKSELENESSIK